MDAHDGLLQIGEFARRAGTNLRTLRYYEELGLLIPASRSQGGFRYYRRCDLNRLGMIHQLQSLGLPLERIRDLTGTRTEEPTRQRFLERVREALAEQDRLLLERIAELQTQRAGVEDAMAKLRDCEVCKHGPTQENNHCEPCQMTGAPLPVALSALY